MLNKKIFITGCAKSGTTLVRRLFQSFEDINVCPKEISIYDFIDSEYDVGKRTFKTIFSNKLSNYEKRRQLPLVKQMYIVNVVRDMSSVLRSSNGYVKPERYKKSIIDAYKYKKHIQYTVDYDILLMFPDKIQIEIAKEFNLKIEYKFSEFPVFVNWDEEGTVYNIRELSTDKSIYS